MIKILYFGCHNVLLPNHYFFQFLYKYCPICEFVILIINMIKNECSINICVDSDKN